jgi:short-subunit dehydrogenase
MRVVIFGCGNIGFETINKLEKDNLIEKIYVFDRINPPHLKSYFETNLPATNKVLFFELDAEDEKSVERAFSYVIKEKIDVLICAIGVFSYVSPTEYFERFKSEFNLNIYGNLIPIKVSINQNLFRPQARIIVISSIAGHYSANTLSSYHPSKWALQNILLTLQKELKFRKIHVDVISPAMIRNKYSSVFNFSTGIEATDVAKLIQKILNKAHKRATLRGGDYFVPTYYYGAHIVERIFPGMMDRRDGLTAVTRRKKLYRNMVLNNGLILGAGSVVGQELADLYSRHLKKLFLLDHDSEALEKLKYTLQSKSNCDISTICLDQGNLEEVAKFAQDIPSVDILINCSDFMALAPTYDTSVNICNKVFCVNFYSPVLLISHFLNKPKLPLKIINILSTFAIDTPDNHGLYSSAKAALWCFTRSMRRMYGNKMQIVEVIVTPSDLKRAGQAKSIFEKEKKGEEMVYIPFLSRLKCLKEALRFEKLIQMVSLTNTSQLIIRFLTTHISTGSNLRSKSG